MTQLESHVLDFNEFLNYRSNYFNGINRHSRAVSYVKGGRKEANYKRHEIIGWGITNRIPGTSTIPK